MPDSDELDIDRLMDEIRSQALDRRPPAQPAPSGIPGLALLANNADVYDVAFRSHRPLLGRFIVGLFKFFRLLLTPILTRQSAYNTANVQVLGTLGEQVSDHSRTIEDARHKIATELPRRFRTELEELERRLSARTGELERRVADAQARIVAELKQEISAATAQPLEGLERLRQRLDRLERSQRRLLHVSRVGSSVDAASSGAPLRSRSAADPAEAEFDGVEFAERFRGREADIQERQRPYVDVFRGHPNVLDVGCGRGEFLELLRDAAISARGIDLDLDMVLLCREKGLDVERADAFEHLRSLEDGSLGGIFAAQVVEHFEPLDVIRLVKLCRQKLAPGGVLLVETPNPACLAVFARSFYMDFSHVRPIHSEAMRFLFESSGLRETEVRYSAPVDELEPLGARDGGADSDIARRIDQLSRLVLGFQDYAVIGVK